MLFLDTASLYTGAIKPQKVTLPYIRLADEFITDFRDLRSDMSKGYGSGCQRRREAELGFRR